MTGRRYWALLALLGPGASESFAQTAPPAPIGQSTLPGSALPYDPELRRVRQDVGIPGTLPELPGTGLPDTPAAGAFPGAVENAPSAPAAQPYELPAAENFTAGEAPTAEAAAEEAEASGPRRLLMEAFGIDPEENRNQVYGWIQNSFTGNPSFPADGINFGVNPNYKSNEWMGNQYYTVFERPLLHEGEFNIGGRFDFLFGNDWQFNKMRGVFDNAFAPNRFAGIDLPQFYGEMHLPIITEGGVDVKFGRWYTLHGYEVVPAIGRPLLSVPYMFTYGQPFTHWGLMTTWNATDNLVIYNGSPQGWDDFQNARLPWTYMGGASWTGMEGKVNITSIYSYAVNQIPDLQSLTVGGPLLRNQDYTSHFTHLSTTVFSLKWSDELTQVIETDFGYEEDVPIVQDDGSVIYKPSRWSSFGNWFLYSFNEKLTGVWRSEVFWDVDGLRTGFADTYNEITLGLIYKPVENIWIRPEARYDWASHGTPYNAGVSSSQFTMGFDVILLY
jgi:hypothetical protein